LKEEAIVKVLRSLKKGDVLMGTVKELRIVDRRNAKGLMYTVAINNCVQGNYSSLNEAVERFEQLKVSQGF
jgi:hypothetical protein